MFKITLPDGKQIASDKQVCLLTQVRIEGKTPKWSVARFGTFAECQQAMSIFTGCPSILQCRIEVGELVL